MLEAGVYIAPSQFEAAMISLALTDADLEKAADAARGWFTGAGS
jgi:glutamate-1-semialdehyde aminotransferase